MKKILASLLLVLLVLVAGFGALQWNSYQKVRDTYEEGLIYFQEKDYEKSLEILEAGSSIHSFFAQNMKEEMLGYQAESYYNLEKYKEAINLYDTLIQKRPDSIVYYTMKGKCYQNADNIEKAKETFLAGWKKTGNISLLQQLCSISIEDGDFDDAVSYIDIGLKEDSEDTKVFLFDKIIVYEKKQDFENAWKAAQEFHAKYPDDKKGEKEYIFLSTRIQ